MVYNDGQKYYEGKLSDRKEFEKFIKYYLNVDVFYSNNRLYSKIR